MSALRMEELSVIGTTTPVRPDDLPARLAPLYADPQGRCYLPVEGEPPGNIDFDLVDATWVAEQEADGDVHRIKTPISARPGHVLLQSNADEEPEYIPESELHHRLVELGEQALSNAALALAQNDKKTAERYAWYASRSTPERPLPLMLLHALIRGDVPEEELEYLEKAVGDFPVEVRAKALEAAGSGLRPILACIRESSPEEPAPSMTSRQPPPRRPRYLNGLKNDSTFLQHQRRLLASVGHSPPAFG